MVVNFFLRCTITYFTSCIFSTAVIITYYSFWARCYLVEIKKFYCFLSQVAVLLFHITAIAIAIEIVNLRMLLLKDYFRSRDAWKIVHTTAQHMLLPPDRDSTSDGQENFHFRASEELLLLPLTSKSPLPHQQPFFCHWWWWWPMCHLATKRGQIATFFLKKWPSISKGTTDGKSE